MIPYSYQISYKVFISEVTHHTLLFPPPHTADQIGIFRFLVWQVLFHLCFSCDLRVGEMGSFPPLGAFADQPPSSASPLAFLIYVGSSD